MNGMERALVTLREYSLGIHGLKIDARVQLLVSIAYIAFVLSVPVADPGRLVWMFAYPIIMAEASGLGYARVFAQSLWVLPLAALVGMFNPIIDHQPLYVIYGVTITAGWASFGSILLRGILAMQALVILAGSCGFTQICHSLQGLGCPAVLTTQLLMLYRYIGVLISEALSMHRARLARGYGRKSYPLRMWGPFIGQLLMRSVRRAQRVHMCMLARGFDGNFFVDDEPQRIAISDVAYAVVWIGAFAAMRFIDLSAILARLI